MYIMKLKYKRVVVKNEKDDAVNNLIDDPKLMS